MLRCVSPQTSAAREGGGERLGKSPPHRHRVKLYMQSETQINLIKEYEYRFETAD